MRVDCIRLGLRYIDLRRRMVEENRGDAAEFNRFIEDCIAHNITIFSEGASHEEEVKAFAEKYWRAD
ncbi:MAG: hypothetical protein E7672_00435 [Ruminococcaceae bacterium]|nr:hypothetical protein [Oscillospiraceae bacterium]